MKKAGEVARKALRKAGLAASTREYYYVETLTSAIREQVKEALEEAANETHNTLRAIRKLIEELE